ncbi:hypothetical protein [Prochlorococcus marinus]|uniref:hypothetical protein n=1 Tax=Prochlorococcus marinus TaxID=1219 RepID=UPI0022B4FDED|nr:hypothetical protein [Prochlorococcus marinus]
MNKFLASDHQVELMNDAYQIISSVLAELRDNGIPDEEIFSFTQTLIKHFDPVELKKLETLSYEKDALFKEANDL